MSNNTEIPQFIAFDGLDNNKIIINVKDVKHIRYNGESTTVETYGGDKYRSRVRSEWFAEKLGSLCIHI